MFTSIILHANSAIKKTDNSCCRMNLSLRFNRKSIACFFFSLFFFFIPVIVNDHGGPFCSTDAIGVYHPGNDVEMWECPISKLKIFIYNVQVSENLETYLDCFYQCFVEESFNLALSFFLTCSCRAPPMVSFSG